MASFIQTLDDGMKTLVFNKFSSYLGLTDQNKGIVFTPKAIAQRKMGEKRGEDSVEFISIWRDPPIYDKNRQRTPLARRGINMEFADGGTDQTSIVNIKAVPATMEYDVYFWTKNLDKLMQISEAYLFWNHTNPQMTVYYNNRYLMQLDTNFGPLVDESPIDRAYEVGPYFVYRAPIKLEGWIATSTSTSKTILEIHMNVYYNDSLTEATPVNSTLLASNIIID